MCVRILSNIALPKISPNHSYFSSKIFLKMSSIKPEKQADIDDISSDSSFHYLSEF